MVFIEYIPWSTLGKNCPASCAVSLSFHSQVYFPSPCLWFFLYKFCPSKARAGVTSSTKAFPESTDHMDSMLCVMPHMGGGGYALECCWIKEHPLGLSHPTLSFLCLHGELLGLFPEAELSALDVIICLQTWGPEKRYHWFSIKLDACKFKKNEDRNKRRGEKIFIWTSLTFIPTSFFSSFSLSSPSSLLFFLDYS